MMKEGNMGFCRKPLHGQCAGLEGLSEKKHSNQEPGLHGEQGEVLMEVQVQGSQPARAGMVGE